MTTTSLKDELDERFLRRQWVVQRVGWGLMALVLALALLGVLGTSPLASTVASAEVAGGRVEVEHARFARYELLDRMHVRVDAPSASGEELRLAFSREWTESNNVRGSMPGADGSSLGPDGASYVFRVEDWSSPIAVVFEFEPRKSFANPGALTIVVGDAPPVELSIASWVHP